MELEVAFENADGSGSSAEGVLLGKVAGVPEVPRYLGDAHEWSRYMELCDSKAFL